MISSILSMSHGQIVAELFLFTFFLVLVVMQWHEKLPTVQSIQELASVINSRGGNIMVLGAFSVLFFFTSVRFTYWFMERAAEGKISAQDALGLAAFTWMTGTAFGGAFTSMVKAMTGSDAKARASDVTTVNREENTTTTPTPPSILPSTSTDVNFTQSNGGNK